MITIVSRNKYTERPVNQKILKLYREFFLTHQDLWFKGESIERIVGKTGCRRHINQLRCEGMPIISDVTRGYKLSNDKKDIRECYDSLRDRALRALTSARLMKKQLFKYE